MSSDARRMRATAHYPSEKHFATMASMLRPLNCLLLLVLVGAVACSSSSGGGGSSGSPGDSGGGNDGGGNDAAPDAASAVVNACTTFVDKSAAADSRVLTWDFAI